MGAKVRRIDAADAFDDIAQRPYAVQEREDVPCQKDGRLALES
jgi:hypothetical protein